MLDVVCRCVPRAVTQEYKLFYLIDTGHEADSGHKALLYAHCH